MEGRIFFRSHVRQHSVVRKISWDTSSFFVLPVPIQWQPGTWDSHSPKPSSLRGLARNASKFQTVLTHKWYTTKQLWKEKSGEVYASFIPAPHTWKPACAVKELGGIWKRNRVCGLQSVCPDPPHVHSQLKVGEGHGRICIFICVSDNGRCTFLAFQVGLREHVAWRSPGHHQGWGTSAEHLNVPILTASDLHEKSAQMANRMCWGHEPLRLPESWMGWRRRD